MARGPKPVAALREVGLTPWATVPSPNTWRELLATLDARMGDAPLAGVRVAVQEYGLGESRVGRGAGGARSRRDHGADLPVVDARGRRAAAAAPCGRSSSNEIEIVILTAGIQLVHLLRVAAEMGLETAVREGLERVVVASIGPMTSEELRRHGLPIDLEPSHPKMGFLVKELAEQCEALLRDKRAIEKPCLEATK